MKPAVFEYAAPKTIPETLNLLKERGAEAKILAGGQSLMPILNMRLAQPATLIDINGVADIANIEITDERISLGALVRQQQLIDDPRIREACPILAEAAEFVAHRTIRNRGTIGGSLVHADPASELPAVMVALEAVMRVHGTDGVKEIPAREFFVDYMTTAVEPDELLVSVVVPRDTNEGSGSAFVEMSRRHGDFAIVAVGALAKLDDTGAFSHVRLVVTGVGPTPHLVAATDQLLGHKPCEDAFRSVAKAASEEIDPQDDIQGTAFYRRHLTRGLCKRALRAATDRAQG
jgi:aerobic carbon-monoxide dehydrogenase medium subunit